MCLAFNRFQFLPGRFKEAVCMSGESRKQLALDAQQISLNFRVAVFGGPKIQRDRREFIHHRYRVPIFRQINRLDVVWQTSHASTRTSQFHSRCKPASLCTSSRPHSGHTIRRYPHSVRAQRANQRALPSVAFRPQRSHQRLAKSKADRPTVSNEAADAPCNRRRYSA